VGVGYSTIAAIVVGYNVQANGLSPSTSIKKAEYPDSAFLSVAAI